MRNPWRGSQGANATVSVLGPAVRQFEPTKLVGCQGIALRGVSYSRGGSRTQNPMGTSARSNTGSATPTNPPAIKQADRAKPRAHESLHQTRGASDWCAPVMPTCACLEVVVGRDSVASFGAHSSVPRWAPCAPRRLWPGTIGIDAAVQCSDARSTTASIG
jgi:hypothetical protein